MSKKKGGGEYEVGYGRPPRRTQFEPGQSGNPNGRPRKAPSPINPMVKEAQARIKISVNGKSKNMKVWEAIILKLRKDALSDDPRARRDYLKLLMDTTKSLEREETSSGVHPSPQEIVQQISPRVRELSDYMLWVIAALRQLGVLIDESDKTIIPSSFFEEAAKRSPECSERIREVQDFLFKIAVPLHGFRRFEDGQLNVAG